MSSTQKLYIVYIFYKDGVNIPVSSRMILNVIESLPNHIKEMVSVVDYDKEVEYHRKNNTSLPPYIKGCPTVLSVQEQRIYVGGNAIQFFEALNAREREIMSRRQQQPRQHNTNYSRDEYSNVVDSGHYNSTTSNPIEFDMNTLEQNTCGVTTGPKPVSEHLYHSSLVNRSNTGGKVTSADIDAMMAQRSALDSQISMKRGHPQ